MAISPLAQAIALQNSRNAPQEQITPANVLGAYQLSSSVAEQNYQAKLAAQNALWGGLAQLGAAGLIGRNSLANLFKGAGSNAAANTGAAGAAGNAGVSGAGTLTTGDAGLDGLSGGGLAMTGDIPGGVVGAAAPTVAADYGLTGDAGAGLAGLEGGGTGMLGSTVAGDLGADAGATAAADMGATGGMDWLASFLPFLA